MGYLLAQIFLCLLIAAALGALIGWFLRGLGRDEPAPAAPRDDAELHAARRRISELERELAECRAKPAPAAPRAAAPAAAAPAAAAAGTALFGTPAERPIDDLKIVSGIGPKIEKQLAGIGITTYKQIANFTQDDIERVNDAIEVFQGRIEREEWVPQAARLHREKYGTNP